MATVTDLGADRGVAALSRRISATVVERGKQEPYSRPCCEAGRRPRTGRRVRGDANAVGALVGAVPRAASRGSELALRLVPVVMTRLGAYLIGGLQPSTDSPGTWYLRLRDPPGKGSATAVAWRDCGPYFSSSDSKALFGSTPTQASTQADDSAEFVLAPTYQISACQFTIPSNPYPDIAGIGSSSSSNIILHVGYTCGTMNVNGAWNYPKYWTDKPIPAIPGAVTTRWESSIPPGTSRSGWRRSDSKSDNGLPMMAWWVLD